MRRKAILLNATVFITGASFLIIELLGTRLLAPYFGTTIYAITSIISVCLGSLSIGYYLGGRLADKSPSYLLFYLLIAFSGVSTALLRVLAPAVLDITSAYFSLSSGPMVASLALFFLPGVLLGMLSPFAIALLHAEREGKYVGSTAGAVFFWSTAGSIVGSICCGFYLLPSFGVRAVLNYTALGLSALGVLGMLGFARTNTRSLQAILLFVVTAFLLAMAPALNNTQNTLYAAEGLYRSIAIYNVAFGDKPVRLLQLDRSTSGAEFLNSNEAVYDFVKEYKLHKVFLSSPQKILALGGGTYSIPKRFLQELPHASIDVVEIEPSLHKLAQRYFQLPASPRLENIVHDARTYLRRTDKTYDIIYCDVYRSVRELPWQFTTKEFFEEVKHRLTENGIFFGNFIGTLTHKRPSLAISIMHTMKEVFPDARFFAVLHPAYAYPQNLTLFAQNTTSARVLEEDVVERANSLVRGLFTREIDSQRFSFSNAPVLSDDYAPVEYLSSYIQPRFERAKELSQATRASIDAEQVLSLATVLPSESQTREGRLLSEFQAIFTVAHSDVRALSSERHRLKDAHLGQLNPGARNRILLIAPLDKKLRAQTAPALALEILRTLRFFSRRTDIGIDLALLSDVSSSADFVSRLPITPQLVFLITDPCLGKHRVHPSANDPGNLLSRIFYTFAAREFPSYFSDTPSERPTTPYPTPTIEISSPEPSSCPIEALQTVGDAITAFIQTAHL